MCPSVCLSAPGDEDEDIGLLSCSFGHHKKAGQDEHRPGGQSPQLHVSTSFSHPTCSG